MSVRIREAIMKKKSLSLVETMGAVAVLSFGIVLVSQGFLIALGGFSYAVDYLNILLWMDAKLWDLQDKLMHYNTIASEDTAGTVIIDSRKYNWRLSYNLIEGTEKASLYELSLQVAWQEGMRKIKTLRTLYALSVYEQ